jgi:hypothetical protein
LIPRELHSNASVNCHALCYDTPHWLISNAACPLARCLMGTCHVCSGGGVAVMVVDAEGGRRGEGEERGCSGKKHLLTNSKHLPTTTLAQADKVLQRRGVGSAAGPPCLLHGRMVMMLQW